MENYFQASELINLEKLTNLQSLAIGGNKIDTFNDIQPLFKLQNLFQLDLSDCKICKQKFYRNTVFSKFPNLKVSKNITKYCFLYIIDS